MPGPYALRIVVGVHVNVATFGFIPFGPVDPEELAAFTDDEEARLEWLITSAAGAGQGLLRGPGDPAPDPGLHPDRFHRSAAGLDPGEVQGMGRTAEVPEDAMDRDKLLTNVMLYCLTGTAESSADLYYENAPSPAPGGQQPGTTPIRVAVFATDYAIRRYAECANHIVHRTEFDHGGHFAAMETPTS
jgi:epoxide hydrolase